MEVKKRSGGLSKRTSSSNIDALKPAKVYKFMPYKNILWIFVDLWQSVTSKFWYLNVLFHFYIVTSLFKYLYEALSDSGQLLEIFEAPLQPKPQESIKETSPYIQLPGHTAGRCSALTWLPGLYLLPPSATNIQKRRDSGVKKGQDTFLNRGRYLLPSH